NHSALAVIDNNGVVGVANVASPLGILRAVGVADFDADGKPDYVLYNAVTHQTAVWYLNNTVFVGGAYGPTLPANWNVVGVADFDRDGKPDYALYSSAMQRTAVWYLNNNVFVGGAYGPSLPANWSLIAP